MNEWIKTSGKVSEAELLDCVNANFVQKGRYFTFYTDKVECGYFDCAFCPPVADVKHLLELRIFNKQGEFKAIRATIGGDFVWRVADDELFLKKLEELENPTEKDFSMRVFVEKNYLDIDTTKGIDVINGILKVIATGGGRYSLPLKEKREKIITQSYLNYSENDGSISVADWRIVGFGKEE